MPENETVDACAMTVAIGSTDLGKTFCTIVVDESRLWPWSTGVNLLPGPSSTFALEADGPLFGRGVERIDWVELIATDKPGSLLSVMGLEPQQLGAATQVSAGDFVLTVNEAWDDTDEDECWLTMPQELAAPHRPLLVNERAELLVLTTTMGRAWMQLHVSSGRGKLRDAPPPPRWWPFPRRRR